MKLQRLPSLPQSTSRAHSCSARPASGSRLDVRQQLLAPRSRRARGCRGAGRPSSWREPPVIRLSHHGFARISSSQEIEVFQSSWTSWSSKIIADGDRREQPADRLVPPGLPVEARVLLEVGHLLAGLAARVPRAIADELARLGRVLVGVDLVADRSAGGAATPRAAVPSSAGQRVERVDLAPVLGSSSLVRV